MFSSDPRIEMVAHRTRAALVLRCGGEIDFGNAEATGAALRDAAAGLGSGEMALVDLTAVTHLSVAGARVLCRFAFACADRAVDVRLVVEREGVAARVAELSGLDRCVSVHHTLLDALDSRLQYAARTSR